MPRAKSKAVWQNVKYTLNYYILFNFKKLYISGVKSSEQSGIKLKKSTLITDKAYNIFISIFLPCFGSREIVIRF